jgi:hypothetical protein
VTGWTRVTASGEVAIGHAADDDADLHVRREQALAAAGSGTTAGIRADLLGLPGATTCQVFENYTDDPDPVTGLPPKSFEAIVWADDASDDDVAQALWDSRGAGIEPIGSSAGTAHDADGNPHVMRFTRPEQVKIWLAYQLVRLSDYVGDESFAATVATRLDAALQPGMTVSEWDVADAAHGLGAKAKTLTFGLEPAPGSKDELAIGARQLARFDALRIALT